MVLTIVRDAKVPFPAYIIKSKTRSKTELREYVASCATSWVMYQQRQGLRGAVMLDIDDTLIDGRESVAFGFGFMRDLYNTLHLHFPIHIVTARPDDEHGNVMSLLTKRGFCIPPDRLHMLPAELYGRSYSHVEDFKWERYKYIEKLHNLVLLRMGDKLWDVARLQSLRGTGEGGTGNMSHITDPECYIFTDPGMQSCMSCKLPGER